METHQLLVADKLTVGELMTTAVLALPPLAPVRQVTWPCLALPALMPHAPSRHFCCASHCQLSGPCRRTTTTCWICHTPASVCGAAGGRRAAEHGAPYIPGHG